MSMSGLEASVVEGRTTELSRFFWEWVGKNRYDHNGDEVIVMYTWDEEHEFAKVEKAKATLAEAEAQPMEYWEKKAEESQTDHETRYEGYNKTREIENGRRQAMIDQIDRQLEAETVWVTDHLFGMRDHLQNGIEHNKPFNSGSRSSADEYRSIILDMYRRDIDLTHKRYLERKQRCDEISCFLTEAQKLFGPPFQGIRIKSSSEMF